VKGILQSSPIHDLVITNLESFIHTQHPLSFESPEVHSLALPTSSFFASSEREMCRAIPLYCRCKQHHEWNKLNPYWFEWILLCEGALEIEPTKIPSELLPGEGLCCHDLMPYQIWTCPDPRLQDILLVSYEDRTTLNYRRVFTDNSHMIKNKMVVPLRTLTHPTVQQPNYPEFPYVQYFGTGALAAAQDIFKRFDSINPVDEELELWSDYSMRCLNERLRSGTAFAPDGERFIYGKERRFALQKRQNEIWKGTLKLKVLIAADGLIEDRQQILDRKGNPVPKIAPAPAPGILKG